ncbi:MAG: hypothetical protein GY711_10060 [bacterium]|nr:hypothetical protein [bacterium]
MNVSLVAKASAVCAVLGFAAHEIGESCVTTPQPPPYIIKPAARSTWSQSVDNTTIVAGSVSCLNNPNGITDNSYWRLYDPLTCNPPVTGRYFIDSVTFGVEAATTTSGSTLITVNLRDGAGFPVGAGGAPILCSAQVSVPDTAVTDQRFVTVSFSPPCCLDPGQTVAVEIMAPNGQPQGDFFFIGSNAAGETAPSYISAVDCGILDPTPFAALGFPNVHALIDIECHEKDKFRVCVLNYNTFGSQPGQFCACGLSWAGGAITGVSQAIVRRLDNGEVIFTFDQNTATTAAWAALLPGGNLQGFLAASGLIPPGLQIEITFCITTQPSATSQDLVSALLAGGIGTDEGTASGGLTGLHLQVWQPASVDAGDTIGTTYCSPNKPNSTGLSAEITASGSVLVADNNVTVTASQVPPNQFGYFISSPTQGFIPNPGGSNGHFCLGGGPLLGRYDGQVQNSGPGGTFSIPIDLTAVPIGAAPGSIAIQPGDTWNFQAWFRDIGNTNNFTDAVSIVFQ